MISVKYDVQVNLNKNSILGKNEKDISRAVKGTAREFKRLAEPYVPWLTGDLTKSANLSDFAHGEITYDTPYVRYVYYRDDKTTNWTTDKHKNAMSHWGDFVKTKYKYELQKVFQRYLNGGV